MGDSVPLVGREANIEFMKQTGLLGNKGEETVDDNIQVLSDKKPEGRFILVRDMKGSIVKLVSTVAIVSAIVGGVYYGIHKVSEAVNDSFGESHVTNTYDSVVFESKIRGYENGYVRVFENGTALCYFVDENGDLVGETYFVDGINAEAIAIENGCPESLVTPNKNIEEPSEGIENSGRKI